MAEFSASAAQTVNPGEVVVFTATPEPCVRGFVKHRDDSGNFLLSGWIPNRYLNGCACNKKTASYLVDFGANIAIPSTGTVGEISVAISIDGTTIPSSIMRVTPAAVEEYFNVSRAVNVGVWRGCCETVSIRNTSSQPILVESANVIFTRPDLNITY